MLKKTAEKLKTKWGITNNWDFFLIMMVFSLAGLAIAPERRFIFSLIGIDNSTPLWVKTIIYIPLIIPLYQISLIIFGFLLGQFNFFWEKEKKLIRFLYRCLRRSKITK